MAHGHENASKLLGNLSIERSNLNVNVKRVTSMDAHISKWDT